MVDTPAALLPAVVFTRSPPVGPVAEYNRPFDGREQLPGRGATMRPPMLDPERDLAGATPETLARALLRRTGPLRPRPGGEPVVPDKPPAGQSPTHETGDGGVHPLEGV